MVCEVGEDCVDSSEPQLCTSACAIDCPITRRACPAGASLVSVSDNSSVSASATSCNGNGMCLSASGTCRCFGGYAGDDCSSCAVGYMRSAASRRCVFLPGALSTCSDGVMSSAEGGVDCGGVCDAPCGGVSSIVWMERHRIPLMTSWIGGGLACVGIAVFVVYRIHRRQRAKAMDGAVSATASAADSGERSAAASQRLPVGRRHRGRQSKVIAVLPWNDGTATQDADESESSHTLSLPPPVSQSSSGGAVSDVAAHWQAGLSIGNRGRGASRTSEEPRCGRDWDWLASATPISPQLPESAQWRASDSDSAATRSPQPGARHYGNSLTPAANLKAPAGVRGPRSDVPQHRSKPWS
jgi:hypothetical protein